MNKILASLPRCSPAALVMIIIFVFSSRPGDDLPDFQGWDVLIKKGGHILGYALLAWSYMHLLGSRNGGFRTAWLMGLAYALTDEIHQAFVPGRSPSALDVLLFDNLGLVLSLRLYSLVKGRELAGS
jgi:VanZ family protein